MCIILSYVAHAQEKVNITYKFIFINSNKGFTYDTKLVLERNGKKFGESKVKDQEKLNEVTFTIPKGNATLKATLYAFNKGTWQARIVKNNYGFDCIYEKNRNWDENATIKITVDIYKQEVIIDDSYISQDEADDDENIDYAAEKEKINSYKSNIDIYNWEKSTTPNSNNSNTNSTNKKAQGGKRIK